jgi:DNA polymerase III subunit delta'
MSSGEGGAPPGRSPAPGDGEVLWRRVVGHVPVVTRLDRAIRDGSLAHATLLAGPDGVGKTTVAEVVATALLGAGSWPGGLAAHPDHWLEDSDEERIRIARMRHGGGTPEAGPSLQDFLGLRPYAGGRRVAVIARADRLTEDAANCVLKTLEEPPPGTHIVLCAAHPERLPATIVSRCQMLGCAPVLAADIRSWLEREHGVAAPVASGAAALAGGRPGRALQLATVPGAMRAETEAIDALLVAAGGGRGDALRTAAALAPPSTAEGRERALVQVTAWTGFLRDVACVAAGAPELAVWERYREAAQRWAQTLPLERIAALLGRCVETADQVAQYAVPRLCYEVLLLDILTVPPAPPRTTASAAGVAFEGPPAASGASPRPRATRRR